MASEKYLELTEYQPMLLESTSLCQAQGETIWQRYGREVAVDFPSVKTNDCWKLTAQGFVGVLPVDDSLTLLLTPKTPISQLWRLVAYTMAIDPPGLRKHLNSVLAAVATVPQFYENLALILAERILLRARRGLVHSYVQRSERLPAVRGQLDIAGTLRHPAAATLHCRYERHTADVPENQILFFTLDSILRSTICRAHIRPTVKRAFSALAGQATLQPWRTADVRRIAYHRLNQDYRPLHALCSFFLEQASPELYRGDAGMVSFALDMALLYERFVAAWLTQNIGQRWRVATQERQQLDASNELAFTVDIVVRERATERARWILDTKYKTPAAAPSADDLAQVLAYAQATGAPEALLVYPAPLTRPLDVVVGGVRVRSLTFDLARDIDEAGQDLLHALTESGRQLI